MPESVIVHARPCAHALGRAFPSEPRKRRGRRRGLRTLPHQRHQASTLDLVDRLAGRDSQDFHGTRGCGACFRGRVG